MVYQAPCFDAHTQRLGRIWLICTSADKRRKCPCIIISDCDRYRYSDIMVERADRSRFSIMEKRRSQQITPIYMFRILQYLRAHQFIITSPFPFFQITLNLYWITTVTTEPLPSCHLMTKAEGLLPPHRSLAPLSRWRILQTSPALGTEQIIHIPRLLE